MKSAEVIKRLQADGWELVRVKGSHHQFRRPGQAGLVTVPDLAGCFSAGESLDAAIEAAREAIDAHVELLMEEGADIPSTRPLAEHQANPDLAGAVWAFVDVPVERYFGPAEKINITVPRRLLRSIDAHAKARHLSRSAFLAQAAREAMGRG